MSIATFCSHGQRREGASLRACKRVSIPVSASPNQSAKPCDDVITGLWQLPPVASRPNCVVGDLKLSTSGKDRVLAEPVGDYIESVNGLSPEPFKFSRRMAEETPAKG